MFQEPTVADTGAHFTHFRVSDKKKTIGELMDYTDDMITLWPRIHTKAPVVYQLLTNENVDIVMNPGKIIQV